MGVAGDLVEAEPFDACLPLVNDGLVAGAVVLVERGGCNFVEKAFNVEQAGAVALVVINNVHAESAFAMGSDQAPGEFKLYAMMITVEHGHTLRSELEAAYKAPAVSLYAASQADMASKSHMTVEHHVMVPDSTQAWLQNGFESAVQQPQVSWQAAMTELIITIQSHLDEVLLKQPLPP